MSESQILIQQTVATDIKTAPNTDNIPDNADSDESLFSACYSDPDLAEIVVVWLGLPEHIKAAIKALVQTHIKGIK